MHTITLHGRELHSVFELLGDKEDDITKSLGWALSRSPEFMKGFLHHVIPVLTNPKAMGVNLQNYGRDGGFTDIEIRSQSFHIIVEAKRNWILPTRSQLEKYRPRFRDEVANIFVALTECSSDFAATRLPKSILGVQVLHVSWREIYQLTLESEARENQNGKRLLKDLRKYMRRIMSVQNQESNLVYVVSLGGGKVDLYKSKHGKSELTWIEIVTRYSRYFHAFGWGGGWPSEPPNYLGFRYQGKLQSVHHVEGYEIISNFHPHFPEIPDEELEPHILYRLGPPISPSHDVKMGSIYPSGRVWVALDLLLTCETVSEARDKTRDRMGTNN